VLAVDLLLILGVATGGLLVGRLLGLRPVVAYLAGGVLVGPGGLGLVRSSAGLEAVAEIGVALLLFGVGIEISLERLRGMLARMSVTGGLQLVLTIGGTALAARALAVAWPQAVMLGFLVSLSSTAIVFKLYDETGEIESPHGLAATAILVFQDLALVPMMLLVPVLARPDEGVLVAAATALGSAAAAVAAIVMLARVVLPRAMALLAGAGVPEVFPLAALVLAFGTAMAATTLGLSMPIGAFLGGLALSQSTYAHQVFAEVLPLRDAFVAVFFTSIGMLFDPGVVAAAPTFLCGLVGAVLAKGLLIAVIVGVLWRSVRIGVATGLALAQIGEFSFVLSREGLASGLVTRDVEQALLGAALLTMAATPLAITVGRRVSMLGGQRPSAMRQPTLRDHVLLIGFGTTGQAIARVLRETGVPFVAVDLVTEQVTAGRREQMPVRFGDATRRAVLHELGLGEARAVVVAVSGAVATRRIVSLVRQGNQQARILVRVRRVGEIDELERLGANDVIPSEFEVSIELFVRLLAHLGVPRHLVRVQESLIRLGHYQALRGVGATPELLAEAGRIAMGGIFETAQVMPGSETCGTTLAELALRRRTGAVVLSVVRDGQPLPPPDGTLRLEAGDLVVLYGPHASLDVALRLFEAPSEG
jgi:CPA2 family monovalent cation:H+ antiporter-2